MDAEQVINKIISEANQKADEIKQQANNEADQLEKNLQNELDDFEKQTEQMAKKAAQDKTDRMLAQSRMQNQKKLLAAKVEVLDDIFQSAAQQVAQMPDDKYKELMTNLMQKAVETGDEEVIVGKNESRINQDFIKQINRKLGSGYKGNLRLGNQNADIESGFILRRQKVQINASIDVLIGQVRDEIEPQIVQMLFQ
jgi:V/A-type H+-transporting ATPase subunit E